MKKIKILIAVILLTAIVAAIFVGCTEKVETFRSTDGCWEYTKNDDGTICLTSILKMEKDVVVPSEIDGLTVSSIGEKLFVIINSDDKKLKDTYSDNTVLESVTFDAQIKEIPNMCFYLCKSLKVVNFPESLEKINDFAFYGCESLEDVQLNAKCLSIGNYAFRECANLKSVKILADELPTMGEKTFYMVDKKGSKDDQYYIISNLKIYVKNIELYNIDTLEAQRKETRKNSYKYWKEYVEAGKVAELQ